MFIASYYPPRSKLNTPIRTSVYVTRDEAAQALFRLCRKATSCQTARAAEIDGKFFDPGIDIQFHARRDFPNEE